MKIEKFSFEVQLDIERQSFIKVHKYTSLGKILTKDHTMMMRYKPMTLLISTMKHNRV